MPEESALCEVEGCALPRRSAAPRSLSGRLCRRHRWEAWKTTDPERYREVVRARSRRQYDEFRSWLDDVKLASGCVDCGYRGHPAALDFDHLPGTEKRFDVSQARRAREVIEAEIAKCEVVCANCHRIRTANRRRQEFSAE